MLHPKKQVVRGGMLGCEAWGGGGAGKNCDVGSLLCSTPAPSRSPSVVSLCLSGGKSRNVLRVSTLGQEAKSRKTRLYQQLGR